MRYLKARDFISHCKKHNLDINEDELEFYEREGYLLPVAREVLPDEYVRLLGELKFPREPLSDEARQAYLDQLDQYPEANRLDEWLPANGTCTDEQIIHVIDREMGHNPYLIQPTPETYKPWKSYEILVRSYGTETKQSTATMYYHSWQIHQVYELQRFPDLYKNRLLFQHVSKDYLEWSVRPWLPRKDKIRTLDDKFEIWDAVSFFITMYKREQDRTFASIPSQYGVKTLNDHQHKQFLRQVGLHTTFAVARYGVSVDSLYTFLYSLLDMKIDYERKERFKLANAITNDIHHVARFLHEITSKEWDGISENLRVRQYPFWIVNEFRKINHALKVCDTSNEVLSLHLKNHPLKFGKTNITDVEAREIVDFCESNNLFILLSSLENMLGTADEEHKFWRSTRYTTLKNLSTSIEYFLKTLALSAKSKGIISFEEHSTWKPLVEKSFAKEPWVSAFSNKILHQPATINDLHLRLTKVQSVKPDTARHFLVSTIARNMTVHGYPTEDWFYGDVSSDLFDSVIYTLFYCWYIAKRDSWI